jgi:hypothetical protein
VFDFLTGPEVAAAKDILPPVTGVGIVTLKQGHKNSQIKKLWFPWYSL